MSLWVNESLGPLSELTSCSEYSSHMSMFLKHFHKLPPISGHFKISGRVSKPVTRSTSQMGLWVNHMVLWVNHSNVSIVSRPIIWACEWTESYGHESGQITWSCEWINHMVLWLNQSYELVTESVMWACEWANQLGLSVNQLYGDLNHSHGHVIEPITWVSQSHGIVSEPVIWSWEWTNHMG
jgi:hypothetical protein